MARSKDSKEKQQLLADFLERVIENLFQCGKVEGVKGLKEGLPPLSDFGWMVIHRCQLNFTNVVLALLYLIRLKQRHPSCKGAYGSGHRLFLAALIVANKYLYDDAYHNHTWAEVSQGAFQLDEVNRMEFELIYFLNFSLGVTRDQWRELVDLLDAKLHTELLNVGCSDSHRHRLTQQCGFGDDSEATSDQELNHQAVFAKEKMNQISSMNAHTPSPLQDVRLRKQTPLAKVSPASSDESTKPGSIHKMSSPSSAYSASSSATLGSLSTSINKGSMLKQVVYRRASLATAGVYPAPRTSRPLPQVPERSRSNSISHPLLMVPMKEFAPLTSSHPRRKSLPALPISTRALAHVNFRLGS